MDSGCYCAGLSDNGLEGVYKGTGVCSRYEWFMVLHPTLWPSSSSMFWEFISNCTQFFRGRAEDEAFQPILSFFSSESATSLFENVQFPLNVRDHFLGILSGTVITGWQ